MNCTCENNIFVQVMNSRAKRAKRTWSEQTKGRGTEMLFNKTDHRFRPLSVSLRIVKSQMCLPIGPYLRNFVSISIFEIIGRKKRPLDEEGVRGKKGPSKKTALECQGLSTYTGRSSPSLKKPRKKLWNLATMGKTRICSSYLCEIASFTHLFYFIHNISYILS